MSTDDALTREQWRAVLENTDRPTFGELVSTIETTGMIDAEGGAAEALVDGAVGDLLEADLEASGMFDVYQLVESADADTDLNQHSDTDDGEVLVKDASGRGSDSEDATPEPESPTHEVGGQAFSPAKSAENVESTTVDREAAVDALRDVLRFYNARVDDEIGDHTDAGEHPDRPTTARDYFTEVRGWNDETVDDLLLGWAPADHVDELVAYLFDRGHSREAMIATGALGEKDTGGLYATFSARYVLPYFDGDGEPAYAIARCTGGDGGGAKGYGGHPGDWKAGKYAKLRHTDERVPFDEPIYGLDTLEEGGHVVVAEGIADAITARGAGYAVLSPVTKEFKEAHYDPLVEALEGHDVGRVTVVADADSIRNASADDTDPETIREAVGVSLSPTGAGIAGALRTASKLGDRTDVDIRVVLPPAPADTTNDLDEFVTGAWDGDLEALLRSAKPADAFPELERVVSPVDKPADAFDDFDPTEYEPTATEADETTGDIRDIFTALDRLDAQRVADRTIVDEWLESSSSANRTFRPTWAPSDYSGTAVFCTTDQYVDTGDRGGKGGPAVMAAIDAGLVRDTQCPEAVNGETWFDAVDHLRDLGFSIPKLDRSMSSDNEADYRTDPRELSATVNPQRAWEAAGSVTPTDLDTSLDLDTTDDSEAWVAPNGGRVGDVVRAVALDAGMIDTADADLDDYPVAYNRARQEYGAPLPRYYTTADAIAEFDAVLDVIGEVTFWDLDTEALNTEITAEGDEVGGEAVRALNPAWRESESEESVIVFDSGTVWDADTERVLDVLRFVALDAGVIDAPGDSLAGELFTTAYGLARTEYGAPLPRWEPAEDGGREITPQLPPSEELVDTADLDGVDEDALDVARAEVEELIGDQLDADSAPSVITSLPATGKTTGTIKNARDRPLSYLAPRKELQAQALDKADRWGVSAEVLPVFSDERVRDEVLDAAVSHVRDLGKDRLRDRWAVLGAAFDAIAEDDQEDSDDLDPSDIFEEAGEDEIDLDRPTCETANGDHGVAWALAVHVARRLGYTPREIHTEAHGLFGADLPCSGDGCTCEYTAGWDSVSDPDENADLLVGSYVHAHVESVRTAYSRDEAGNVERQPRGLVLDEFPGEAFVREFGGEAFDHATWLASALCDDIQDRRDTYDADLWGDEWVRAWLNGEADDVVGDAIDALARTRKLLDARAAAEEILDEVDREALDSLGLADPLDAVADASSDAAQAFERLVEAINAVDPNQPAAGLARWADDAVREPLREATVMGSTEPDLDALNDGTLPSEGELADLVDRAVEAVRGDEDSARAIVEAALTALRGGSEGCRRLAAWADDGYAHPDAHHLLTAVITPTGRGGRGERIRTSSWAFDPDATEGTVLDVVSTTERDRVVADRNDHGALLHTPPARHNGSDEESSLIGLDATGRADLWSTALGEGVTTADIHTTPTERSEFLRSALSLRVIQAADRPRPYEGDPTTKDTDGDVALLEALADEYSGIEAPRVRGDEAVEVGKPAAITTKGVREVLEADTRLDGVVAEWENYGNVTGANDLGGYRLAALLGSQHYGDDAIERFCALAGEEVDTSRERGRGTALNYGNDLANTYLKHMSEDQTMQAILRFARGDSGATVVARTSALREDLPVVGRGQVVETWSDTATKIARQYRRLGREFTAADVRDAVDVSGRQVRRVLAELVEAGYLRRDRRGEGLANVYKPAGDTPGAGEVDLPERSDAVENATGPGQSPSNQYYTWNVRVFGGDSPPRGESTPPATATLGAPPGPEAVGGVEPPS